LEAARRQGAVSREGSGVSVERSGGRLANPFDGELARANGSRVVPHGGRLVRTKLGEPATPLQQFVYESFRALVLNPAFSCVGAKSAIRRGSYNLGLYEEMGSPGSTAGLARDLFDFVEEQDDLYGEFSTFVACFKGPVSSDEKGFEVLLWEQLQRLHEEDRCYHRWDPSVSPDPEDPEFAFSFAGRAFFVVGLHAASSRFARRFAWPTLVFNAHRQFDKLRENGQYDRVQEVIRKRERDLQGTLNPNLADFGARSEARQYSGRPVQEEWRCPFHGPQADDPHNDARASDGEKET
jgi:FPC/CPF motif-containing protein YcgG